MGIRENPGRENICPRQIPFSSSEGEGGREECHLVEIRGVVRQFSVKISLDALLIFSPAHIQLMKLRRWKKTMPGAHFETKMPYLMFFEKKITFFRDF